MQSQVGDACRRAGIAFAAGTKLKGILPIDANILVTAGW
jgi:hypothetical protein